jgi:hypothetical protein
MKATVDAVHDNGHLLLSQPLSPPNKSPVRVTIEIADPEREMWLRHSEQSLMGVWDNSADDTFNELLKN